MIYTGRSKDGSDAIQAGLYVSPDEKEWSNMPYTKTQKEHASQTRIHWIVFGHISGKRTLRDEYNLIKNKTSTLPRTCRDYVITAIEE